MLTLPDFFYFFNVNGATPPILPIKEQITQLIVAQLQTIIAGNTYTVGDSNVQHQYQISVSAVERVIMTAGGNVPADLKIVLREGDDREAVPSERNEGGGGPIRHQRWFRPYVATIYLADNDPTVPFDQKKNVASADVINCLLQNRQWKAVVGGNPIWLADDTYPRGTTSFEAGDDMPGIDVNFEVEYTTGENDCYSL